VTANNNGEFSTTITVPPSIPSTYTIAANLASKTFTVTSSTTPVILVKPNSGPVGTSVNSATFTGSSSSGSKSVESGRISCVEPN